MSYLRRHKEQRLTQDADEVEIESIKLGSTTIDIGSCNERIAGSLDDYKDPNISQRPEEDDVALDSFVGSIQEEIKRRIKLLGDFYPFSLDKNNLRYKNNRSQFYEFLLLICHAENFYGNNKDLPRLFERITAKIIATYFGEYADSFHTGSPRDGGTSFQTIMKQINKSTEEFQWKPERNIDSSYVKDESCDFVVCLRHVDKRKLAQLFILGQCACGNDWESKWNELNIKKIEKWFNPMTIVKPVKAFATPYHVTDSLLKEASREAGLFFDRARLTIILQQSKNKVIDNDMEKCINEFIDKNFK